MAKPPLARRHAALWFGRTVRAGVIVNIALAAPAVVAPATVLGVFGLQTGDVDLWARFAAFLLVLLSLFYLPPARLPYHTPTASWLTVVARVGGVGFFTTMAAVGVAPANVLLLAAIDATFAILQGAALWVALGRSLMPEAAPQ